MKDCTCIVIDDKKGFTKSALITNFLKNAQSKNHLRINLIQLNPKEEKFVDDDGSIISERVVQELNTPAYLRQAIHLIICDYDLTDEKINGFEVIRLLRKTLNCQKKILLYSSNIRNVVDQIIKQNSEEATQKIIDLTRSNISDFCQRDEDLVQSIIKHLKEETVFSTDLFFQEQLYAYKDYYFKAPYQKFENKKLGEIADFIAQRVPEAEDLKKEMIEQTIAYMINMEVE